MERLADLDELVLRCRTEAAKTYISEAVSSYRAGAYRASIITTWIAVVFDIIEKIRELSLSGNGEAKEMLECFENHQRQLHEGNGQAHTSLLKFEREILENSRDKLQLLDEHQFTEVSRIREDRNRCAHPTFQQSGSPYRPSAELARVHLRNAIIYLLEQPPVQGKAALDDLMKRVSSEYFPTDLEEIRTTLQESPLARPTESLIKGFFDRLIFTFFEKETTASYRRRIIPIIKCLLEINRGVVEPRIKIQFNKIATNTEDDDFVLLLVFSGLIHEAWASLSEANRSKIFTYVQKETNESIAPYIWSALAISELEEIACQKVREFEAKDLSAAIKQHVKHQVFVERAVELYSTVKNYRDANFIAENLVIPLLSQMDIRQIERIVASPQKENSDLKGSGGFAEFLEKIISEKILTNEALDELLTKYDLESYTPSITLGV